MHLQSKYAFVHRSHSQAKGLRRASTLERGTIGARKCTLHRSRLPGAPALPVALDGIDAGAASEVVNALKGPTLSEMLGYAQYALHVVGDAWVAATSPLAVFGPDRWGISLLFYAAVGLLAYNLIIAAPKQ
ncbi:hypothetical protein HYH02_008417 [Chlamydomonas schloesseri]|uniref:Uncharacterized protein n=1 Tax=Chlamydomonas schloesseri TaxID=2026947 RepID=A0A836B3R8_9CHLO|nr:hypothetical protein HYH02_008417 [Chlamydomonas schloesseri]|eukprot:KAG2446424.1 hypothetical protein HYH02_008417 [Chlamydomonas schloesseri]